MWAITPNNMEFQKQDGCEKLENILESLPDTAFDNICNNLTSNVNFPQLKYEIQKKKKNAASKV